MTTSRKTAGERTLSDREIAELVRDPTKPVHLVGIGGVGMAGVAYHLQARGFPVTGSDAVRGRITDWLTERGVRVAHGHQESSLPPETAWVIRTPAVPASNPELRAAQARGLPVVTRGRVLPALLAGTTSVAVSGTHGKTTTAAMIATVLAAAGLDPSYCIGGELDHLGGVAHAGSEPWFVVEADESDGTLVHYQPDIAVVTNVEFDHMEHFANADEFERCFVTFVQAAATRIYWRDDPVAHRLVAGLDSVSFGAHAESDVRLVDIRLQARASSFRLRYPDGQAVTFELPVPGRYNVWNATAACALAFTQGLPVESVQAGLGRFRPARRRFEIVLDSEDLVVVSDYAHHPTEIAALLETAGQLGRSRIVVVFQPHRYTRTLALSHQFPAALQSADELILAPVYAASEEPLPGGTTEDLYRLITDFSDRPVYLAGDLEDAWGRAVEIVRPGDLFLVVGAGDVESLAFRARDRWAG